MSDSPRNDKRLTVIYYNGNGDEVRRILAQAIKDNPQLTYLLLPGNNNKMKGSDDENRLDD